MKLHSPGHSYCGFNVNPYLCGDRLHATCSGFSGGYDTYLCGCCCHDEERGWVALSDEDRTIIRRVRGEVS